jgi:hypothetical protein
VFKIGVSTHVRSPELVVIAALGRSSDRTVAALESGRLPCSDGTAQILRIAASIADGIPVDLRDWCPGWT